MSFRKRNTVITSASNNPTASSRAALAPVPGVRPSPLDGRATTSTGTSSLDNILAGHAGLPLGTSILIGEHGTTDFSGILLRYYAAEGLVQGHQVHVLGMHEAWRGELPGLSIDVPSATNIKDGSPGDKMKIAWRYENLESTSNYRDRDSIARPPRPSPSPVSSKCTFCHSFDLSKRLSASVIRGTIRFYPCTGPPSLASHATGPPSPLKAFIKDLDTQLYNSSTAAVHRVVVYNLLSPTMYASSLCRPAEVLQFLHALRALLRRYPTRLSAMITVPLTLFPRSTGLSRWMELFSDGVLELIPLPADSPHVPPPSSNKADSKVEDRVQGLLKVHTLPIFHEKGGGGMEGKSAREDVSFSLSRSKGLIVKPFSLPPVGNEDPENPSQEGKKENMDF